MQRTDWYPPNVDPVRVGNYEMINTSTSLIFPVFFNGSRWFHDRTGPVVPLVRVWPWRGLTLEAYMHDLEPYGAQLAGQS
ncbi:hypothetical protein [Paraburkholderia youngii]|uniref:hypothetical protein n=1 Tax=Paraburkholderia youngii TaxID=2782701 RepID=UPI003D2085CE